MSCSYIEQGSKNLCDGLGDLRVENKEVSCHAVRENVLVFLLELDEMLVLSLDLAMKHISNICSFHGCNLS